MRSRLSNSAPESSLPVTRELQASEKKRTDSARFAPVFWAATAHTLRTLPYFELSDVCSGKAKSCPFCTDFHGFRHHFRCFLVTFGSRGVPLRPSGRPWARGGVPGRILDDFGVPRGDPFGTLWDPFRRLFRCRFRHRSRGGSGTSFRRLSAPFRYPFRCLFRCFSATRGFSDFCNPSCAKA